MGGTSGGRNAWSGKRGGSGLEFSAPSKKFQGSGFVNNITPIPPNNKGQRIIPSVTTRNAYSLLDIENDQASDNNMEAVTTRQPRAPPIVIRNSNPTAVQAALNGLVPSKKFEMRLMKVGIRVNIPDFEENQTARTGLLASKFEFYTYHTADTRPMKVVLYGMCDVLIEDVKKQLADKNVLPTEVKKLVIKNPLYPAQAVYLLYFKPGTTSLSELRKIKDFDHLSVKWAKFHPRKYDKVAQCHNCQLLGHSSVNCHLPPCCVICSDNHNSNDCPKKRSRADVIKSKQNGEQVDDSYIKCALCSGNHTANYPGCEKRQEFLKMQQSRNRRPMRSRRHEDYFNANDFNHFPQPSWSQAQSRFPNDGNQQRFSFADATRASPAQSDVMIQLVSSMKDMMAGMQQMMNQMTQVMCTFIQHASSQR